MKPIRSFKSSLVGLPVDDIDTDQIIPARYLKTTDREGLGDALFADWRYDAAGRPRPEFPLNRPEARGARLLVAGRNFGCGSSREHAPWALQGYGFLAVVSSSFADIFRSNAIANGLLPIALRPAAHAWVLHLAVKHPEAQVTVDLRRGIVTLPDGATESFPMDGFDRECLLQGVDRMGYLLGAEMEIGAFEAARVGYPAALAAGGRYR